MKRKYTAILGSCLAVGAMAALALGLASCGSHAAAPSLTSISVVSGVTPAPPSLVIGSNEQFVATASYSDNSSADVSSQATWSSDNTTVATVDSTGLVTALAPGSANITAALSGLTSPEVNVQVTSS